MSWVDNDIIEISPEIVRSWVKPRFQREVKATEKYGHCVEYIRRTATLPGVITLGILDGGDPSVRFKIDGNHRAAAYLDTGMKSAMAEVRYFHGTMEEMAEEWRRLNDQINPSKPDNRLAARAEYDPKVSRLKSSCKVISFSGGTRKPPVQASMSAVLRAWDNATRGATPSARGKASSAEQVISNMSEENLTNLIKLINLCESSWGRDLEYAQLWGQLNMTLIMWIYSRVVVIEPTSPRVERVSFDLFEKCLMALSSDVKYMQWLRGKNAGSGKVHWAPGYGRIKTAFVTCIQRETNKKANLPQPDWA